MQNPLIRFKNGWLLEEKLTDHYRRVTDDSNWQPLSNDERLRVLFAYEQEWKKREEEILSGMQGILDLTFSEKDITVYIVSASRGGTSDPLIIGTRDEPDAAVDRITHELLHRLLSENREQIATREILQTLYPDEGRKVRNHIVLHATHEKLYEEILNAPERLKRDKDRRQKFPEYKRAWEIVEKKGANIILEEFKSHY